MVNSDFLKNGFISLDKSLLSNKKFHVSDTILIAGTPRSGTTWIMELLNTLPHYKTIFEPLNPYWFPDITQIGFNSRPYVPVDEEWVEGRVYLNQVLSGRLYHPLDTYPFKPKMLWYSLFASKLIVKFVRLNRLLPWVSKNFSLKHMFFIIRHPCATISSQLKTGYTGYHVSHSPYHNIVPSIEILTDEINKINDVDIDYAQTLKRIHRPEELLAFSWCLDTLIPLVSKESKKWSILFYEQLISERDKGINNIFNSLHENRIPRTAYKHLATPSMVTKDDDIHYLKNNKKQLSKWTTSLGNKSIQNILRVVSDFHLDFYTKDVSPDYDKFNEIFGR